MSVLPPPPPSLVAGPVGAAPDLAPARAEALGAAAIAATGLGTVLVIGRSLGLHLPPCPFRALTGVPCPGCGITRLAGALGHGHLADAVSADLLGIVLLVAIAATAATALAVRVRHRAMPRLIGTWAVIATVSVVVLARWVTTVVGGVADL